MERKGQVSPDYLVTIILLGVIALAVFGMFSSTQEQAFRTITQITVKDLAQDIAGELTNIAMMGDGSQKTVRLAKTLEGAPYNITLRTDSVLIMWKDSDYASRFPAVNLNQTEINLLPGEILLRNVNGTIYVENHG